MKLYSGVGHDQAVVNGLTAQERSLVSRLFGRELGQTPRSTTGKAPPISAEGCTSHPTSDTAGQGALTTPLPKPGEPEVAERTDRITETFEPTIPIEPHADAIEVMGDPSPSIALGRRSALSIGRSRFCDLRLDSGFVSGHHLELRLVHGAWTVVDLGSLNGVFVDGVRVVHAQTLRVGQVVRCGRRGPAFRLITREAQ